MRGDRRRQMVDEAIRLWDDTPQDRRSCDEVVLDLIQIVDAEYEPLLRAAEKAWCVGVERSVDASQATQEEVDQAINQLGRAYVETRERVGWMESQ